jgi:hypothetical protein
MVVMTDGRNTLEFGVPPGDQRAAGPSAVFVYRVDASGATVEPGFDLEHRRFRAGWDQPAARAAWPEASARIPALEAVYDVDVASSTLGDGSADGIVDVADGVYYSLYSADTGRFYVTTGKAADGTYTGEWLDEPYGGEAAIELTWPELHGLVPLDTIRYDLGGSSTATDRGLSRDLGGWYALSDYGMFSGRDRRPATFRAYGSLDTPLSRTCAALREKSVVIYAIAFDAPREGERAMRDCAGVDLPSTAPNRGYYYEAGGSVSLREVFGAIASSLQNLRLIE